MDGWVGGWGGWVGGWTEIQAGGWMEGGREWWRDGRIDVGGSSIELTSTSRLISATLALCRMSSSNRK